MQQFKKLYLDNGIWGFIPVGNNLVFECRFMKYKLKQYCDIEGLKLGQNPMIDLKHCLIIMNHGRFKGYSHLIGKNGRAASMAHWYTNKDYDLIKEYIVEEATSFIEAYVVLKNELPKIQLHTFE